MFNMKRICHLIFRLLFLLDGGVFSLKNHTIFSPRAVLSSSEDVSGGAATLRCSYDLEGAALYSIRWYRGDTEFYRYVPREMPPAMVFPLPGATIDLSQSDECQVRIVGLHRRLSGLYQCEVSADAPLFHTDIQAATLTIVDPPFHAPRLSVSSAHYSRGGVLRANCSVDESYPPANITWTIDNHKIAETISPPPPDDQYSERGAWSSLELTVTSSQVEAWRKEMEEEEQSSRYYVRGSSAIYHDAFIYDESQSKRQLKEADDKVLKYSVAAPSSGQLSLRCVATIFDVYARSSEAAALREHAPTPASRTRDDTDGAASSEDLVMTSLAVSCLLLNVVL